MKPEKENRYIGLYQGLNPPGFGWMEALILLVFVDLIVSLLCLFL